MLWVIQEQWCTHSTKRSHYRSLWSQCYGPYRNNGVPTAQSAATTGPSGPSAMGHTGTIVYPQHKAQPLQVPLVPVLWVIQEQWCTHSTKRGHYRPLWFQCYGSYRNNSVPTAQSTATTGQCYGSYRNNGVPTAQNTATTGQCYGSYRNNGVPTAQNTATTGQCYGSYRNNGVPTAQNTATTGPSAMGHRGTMVYPQHKAQPLQVPVLWVTQEQWCTHSTKHSHYRPLWSQCYGSYRNNGVPTAQSTATRGPSGPSAMGHTGTMVYPQHKAQQLQAPLVLVLWVIQEQWCTHSTKHGHYRPLWSQCYGSYRNSDVPNVQSTATTGPSAMGHTGTVKCRLHKARPLEAPLVPVLWVIQEQWCTHSTKHGH